MSQKAIAKAITTLITIENNLDHFKISTTIICKGTNMTIDITDTQYLVDGTGAKTAVFVPIQIWENLLEDIEDLKVIAERKDEPLISHESLVAELKKDGRL